MNTVVISHESALEYWRGPFGRGPRDIVESAAQAKRALDHATSSATAARHILERNPSTRDISKPIELLTRQGNACCLASDIRLHRATATFPCDSLVNVGGGAFVCTPELTFVQCCSNLDLFDAIRLGYELCGSYAIDPKTQATTYGLQPLTNTSALASAANQSKGIHGSKTARTASRYTLDGSASPMETILPISLSLPMAFGGVGFTAPLLNSIIQVPRDKVAAIGHQFFCIDLYWPRFHLALEYDSTQFHSGKDSLIADSKRRTALTSLGIDVISVTSAQLYDRNAHQTLVEALMKKMHVRLRPDRMPQDYDRKRRELLDRLLETGRRGNWKPDF